MVRAIKTYDPRPAHIGAARSDTGVSVAERDVTRIKRVTKPKGTTPKLDVAKFSQALHDKIGLGSMGYAWQMRRRGVITVSGNWGYSRNPADGGQGWTSDTRMHIASVSKLITAMATVHVLRAHGIAYDDPVSPYLPEYWVRGTTTDKITFRQLLTHMSGLRAPGSDTDYGTMMTAFSKPVWSTIGKTAYENTNFGLSRILIPIITGQLDPSDTFGTSTNVVWDLGTTSRFLAYCQQHVFSPSGVGPIGFAPGASDALAYRFPSSSKGWDSKDLRSVSGGSGFRMTVNEVLDVMGSFRRAGTIVSPVQAQECLDGWLGIDQRTTTSVGRLYNKNGRWDGRDGMGPWQTEQCVAFFLPEDMELVVFVNSQIGPNRSLRKLVTDAYVANIV